MSTCSGPLRASGAAERSIERVTATARTPWIAWWALRQTPSQTVRSGIQSSGDRTSRRDVSTSKVSLLVVLAVKVEVRCHSETCRKRCDAIEKKKLDKQMEEAVRNAEPALVCTVEMEVEQPQMHPMTGGASSTSGPEPSGQEAVPLRSPSSHAVRMEITESSGSRRPLEECDESSSKRTQSLAGMIV